MNCTLKFLKVSLFVLLILITIVAFIIAGFCAITFLMALFQAAVPECFGLLGFAFLAAFCGFALIDALKLIDDKFW